MKNLLACLACLLFLFASPCEAAVPKLTLSPVPTIYTGTRYSFTVKVAKDAADSGPFQVHIVLPDGMTYESSNTGYWSCAQAPEGAQEVDCTSQAAIPNSTTFSVHTHTSPDLTLGPAMITATIESDQYPLPSPLDCQPTPSTTGCATAATTVEASSLTVYRWNPYDGAVVTWPADEPWVAGETHQLALQIQNIGFGQYGGQVVARVEMPPGVSYAGRANIDCTAEGQVVTCVPASYAPLITNVYFDVALANDIPVPGPILFHAAISNDVQQPALANCKADPAQVGCGRLSVPTRVPRVADLRFKTSDGATHAPGVFVLGRENGPIQLNFENIGDGNATATTVAVKLPPGFDNVSDITSSLALTCSTSGDVDAGLILTCTGAGLPPASGWLRFNVTPNAMTETPGPVVVLGAIDESNPPSTDTLTACASDPSHGYCLWHDITTYAPCALQYGEDGIYCDGFDVTVPVARTVDSNPR
jgi:hypothetical protein